MAYATDRWEDKENVPWLWQQRSCRDPAKAMFLGWELIRGREKADCRGWAVDGSNFWKMEVK